MAIPIAPTAIRLFWKKDWTLLWQPCRKERRRGEKERGGGGAEEGRGGGAEEGGGTKMNKVCTACTGHYKREVRGSHAHEWSPTQWILIGHVGTFHSQHTSVPKLLPSKISTSKYTWGQYKTASLPLWMEFWTSLSDEEERKKTFWPSGNFWFGIFVMLFCASGCVAHPENTRRWTVLVIKVL